MKIQVPAANISFNASAKTVTFTSTVPATLDRILHVCNVTRGVIYFQPQAGAAFTGTYSSPTLTLAASTTGHANGDVLLVFIEDGTTTLPVSLASTPLPSGAATSALQTTGNTSLTSIDTKTPALMSGRVPVETVAVATDANGNGTREYNLSAATRTVVGSTSSAAVAIGTLGTSREVMWVASSRCFVRLGTSEVTAAASTDANVLPIAVDSMFHVRIPAGVTHYTVIRDTADGIIRCIPVA